MAKRGRPRKDEGSRSAGGGLTALVAMLGPQGLKGLEEVGPIECRGYGVTLTPWWCIENQLSDYCLDGFPCETCEQGVTIIPPNPPKMERRLESLRHQGEKDRRRDACTTREAKDHRLKTCATHQKPKTKNQKRLLKTMTRAVARDLGLI